ncbi:MAG: hypothetical protein V4753_06500 [Pseudomonadota bacterium]
MRYALVLVLAAVPALAEPPLTAEDFDALTLGRTMTWAENGTVYGVEQYLPGRRVRWSGVGEGCTLGHWYADGPAICFKYENDLEPDCWIMTRSDTGLDASYAPNPSGADPVVVEETAGPPACLGPEVGV